MCKRLGGLFSKAILVLSIVSVVPVLIIGYHVLSVDSRVLKTEILEKQKTVASRLASILRSNVTRKAQLFSIFTDLHTDFGGHQFIDEEDITYLREKNPEIAHISVLNRNGKQLFYSGDNKSRFSYASELDNILSACVIQGKEYVGSVHRTEDTMFALMAFPLRIHRTDEYVSGVLVVELNLKDLGEALAAAYPKDMSAVIFASDGTIISYSGAPGGLALTPQPELTQKMLHVERQLGARRAGEIRLEDGKKVLVTEAEVPITKWVVYVQQSANVAQQLLLESTFHSVLDVLVILLGMTAFVVIVSYLVIVPITRPLKSLQEAAVKLRESDEYTPTESDVEIPKNEIGDLASVFLEMSSALRSRKAELLKAQKELSDINRDLEKRVEERTRELKEATGELVKSERLAAIGQMASIISHEIRNPLAVISNATRLIKTIVAPTEPKLIKQFGIIDEEIKQASSIINEVLGYARSRDLILTAIEVNSYVREILLSYPLNAAVKLVEDLDPESVRIKVDAEEIKQAIRNLISNAAESMPGGGTLTVGTKIGRKAVCIYVSDTGPGISEELRNKIFSPFFTTKARGTGLGLAVVRKAISRHAGKLFITSEQGKGSCFQIYLRVYNKPGDTKYGEAS